MKKLVFCICTLCLVFITSGQAQKDYGPVKSEERSVGSFTGISVQDGLDVYIRQGSSTELMVKANEDIINDIITDVKDNTLVIKRKEQDRKKWNWKSWGNRKQAVYITLKDLERLSTSGGSDVITEKLNLDNLMIRTSGGSDIEMDIDAQEIEMTLSGGSDINIEGSVEELYVRASGGADLNARRLKAVNCKVNSSGGSDVNIYASGKLSMNASGASDINYSGPAEVVSKNSSGAADISKN